MGGVAITRADRATGEVLESVSVFSMTDYLAGVNSPAGFQQQQALSVAYDAAVRALIGPNDVQKEGDREFKKKSAWRKLARHFSISVVCDPREARIDHIGEGAWIAVAGATASGPWGQSWTDVGACGSDEATGRRVITFADAIATAMTRASNRAVSNLIAMGEVSAEEIGNRRPLAQGRSGGSAPSSAPGAVPTMPFGKTKGTPIDQIALPDLQGAVAWAEEKQKFADWRAEVAAWLASQKARAEQVAQGDDCAMVGAIQSDPHLGGGPGAPGGEDPPLEDDDLPF